LLDYQRTIKFLGILSSDVLQAKCFARLSPPSNGIIPTVNEYQYFVSQANFNRMIGNMTSHMNER